MLPGGGDDAKQSGFRQMFSHEEDQLLKLLVARFGEHWKEIASQMPDRTSRQCRERYKNYLAPAIKNGPWTEDEDQLLSEMVKQWGFKWAKIAKYFKSRSNVNVKNRWSVIASKTKPATTARLDIQTPPNADGDKPKVKPKLPPITSLDGFNGRSLTDPRDDPQDAGEDLSKTFPNYAGNFW